MAGIKKYSREVLLADYLAEGTKGEERMGGPALLPCKLPHSTPHKSLL
jgi:hypothetical protein